MKESMTDWRNLSIRNYKNKYIWVTLDAETRDGDGSLIRYIIFDMLIYYLIKRKNK